MVKICRHFGDCGGCSLFEADHESESLIRRTRATEILQGTLGGEMAVLSLQHRPARLAPRHFRNRVLYPIQPHRRKGLTAGLYRQGTHELVEIERCETQDPDLTALARAGLQLAREQQLEAWDEKTGEGFVRAFDLRVMASTGEALFTIVTRGGLWEGSGDFAAELGRRAKAIERSGGRHPFRLVGILRNLNDEPGNRVLGRRYVPLLGRDYQTDRVGKPLPRAKKDRKGATPPLALRVSAGSFYQSHKNADALLYRPIFEELLSFADGDDASESLRGQRVVDAYAGVGAFAIRAARAGAGSVEVVEENPRAMKDAMENFRRNGLADQASFHLGRTAEMLHQLEARPGLLMIDPPRAGLRSEGIEAVLALDPTSILYVSCHGPSLARDIGELVQRGPWEIRSQEAADLFPRTGHLEIVTLLGPKGVTRTGQGN